LDDQYCASSTEVGAFDIKEKWRFLRQRSDRIDEVLYFIFAVDPAVDKICSLSVQDRPENMSAQAYQFLL
jgi:hypothetical protein